MLEIVFSESACGAIKLAQRYGEGKYRGGAIGVVARNADGSAPSAQELARLRREAEARERRAWERAKPLGGQRADVFCFNLALGVGSVAGRASGNTAARRSPPSGAGGTRNTAKKTLGRALQTAQAALETVRERFGGGEALRVWHSVQADEACGLRLAAGGAFPLAGGARGTCCWSACPPTWRTRRTPACAVSATGGEVNIEHWGRLAEGQRAVSPALSAPRSRTSGAPWRRKARPCAPSWAAACAACRRTLTTPASAARSPKPRGNSPKGASSAKRWANTH